MVIHTNVSHLDDAIDYYKMKNFGTRPYIFMNEDTMKGLGCINAFTRVFEYDGCRVFEDVKLDTCEVELR